MTVYGCGVVVMATFADVSLFMSVIVVATVTVCLQVWIIIIAAVIYRASST